RERALHDEVSELRAEREKGKIEGMIKGNLEGEIKGMIKGKLEGKLEGESMLLERLIFKRFGSLPDDVRARLRTATTDQLEAWAERILDSCTLAEIFNDH
ncbi:DUF4351 domain-containing protein, partial [Propionivibrio sp.]|uniref:DUF4351 domain-containing protein n=1 Tax=Propionivibrio sp. TaxID=2212460 RepID=UPI003BEFB62A